MKPTVISANANASGSANPGNSEGTNSIHIPINREFPAHFGNADSSPNSQARPQPTHQIPQHFQQDFGFEPDMDIDMDMFPRSRLGRMHHDPFSGFNTSHFGFPEFGSMGRRRRPAAAADGVDDDRDFFNRLPSEFRQYIPEGFGARHRGGNSAAAAQPHVPPQQQHHPPQHYPYHGTPPSGYAGVPHPQSPSKKVCDAAIQTEDPASSSSSHDQVDHAQPAANLNQHGLRNTFDMGVKATPESEQHGPRARSAPPPEQMQQQQNNGRHATPPQQSQFGTQTSPQTTYQKAYYPPQHQPHPQQKQQTPPPSSSASQQQQPQTPGGTYIRTIPIFVEGRSEPVINAHKEIPNQYAQPQANATHAKQAGPGFTFPHPQQQQPEQQHHQQQQQQHHPQRPSPLNTQQQPQPQDQQQTADGVPPQTPHTLDSINKIQDIQRDVLDLMGKVEKFTGTRKDKEYAYLDEMLTRNLLKLDTIDTNGKESIRLARKEAIKCIQASINVLEAKAEENAKTAKGGDNSTTTDQQQEAAASNEDGKSSAEATTNNEQPSEQSDPASTQAVSHSAESTESKAQCEPIPLPPPPSADHHDETANGAAAAATKESSPKPLAEAATESSATSETK